MLLPFLTGPGDVILTESLTDPGVLDIAQIYKLKLYGLKIDEQGIVPGTFEDACLKGIGKILYCIPTLHNPTTAIMPAGRRKAIAEIAKKNNVTIIENGTLNWLCREDYPSISSFASDISYFITSFSKCISPAIRLGIIRSSEKRINDLSFLVRAYLWMVSPIIVELVIYLIENGYIDQILSEHLVKAERYQNIAEEMLGRYKYQNYRTAYHMWVNLKQDVDLTVFRNSLHDKGVNITTSEVFCTNKSAIPKAFRIGLNSAINENTLRKALEIISNFLSEN